ncbi:hypothetical protein HR060_15325 [Catenovulum sp. SM1970]|uniref:hypothetical protein n=1 Tax=Marinifaba aquimaris TaxID=2741323 RepID=UPI001573801C|nr:hypothetical protein [Marinifaba aquimaris]NTS78222.1 hypothetical protein [Marinifaba aquimaris]
MKTIKGLFILFFTLAFSFTAKAEEVLLATIDVDVQHDYQSFLSGRDPLTIKDFSGDYSRRDVAEIILMQQALSIGGLKQKLDFKVVQGYDHSLQLVTAAVAVIRGSPLWGADASRYPEQLYISQNLVKPGEFNVGAYTRKANTIALGSNDYASLTQLTAVSSRSWVIDWRTLKRMKMHQVIDVQTWPKMVEYVATGKADFTLAPFQSTPDMSLTVGDHTLIPIPNVKVALYGSRHWIVSKQHPKGEAVFKALRQGIAELLEADTINRAYQESGFYHQKTLDWPSISPKKG